MDIQLQIDSPNSSTHGLKPFSFPAIDNIELPKSPSNRKISRIRQLQARRVDVSSRNSTKIPEVEEEPSSPGYFGEDSDQIRDESKEVTLTQCNKGDNPYELYFKPGVFIKFFLMHVLFFLLLGPFIIVLTPIFGLPLLKNQGFAGWNFSFILQTLQYSVIIAFMIVFYKTDVAGLHGIEIYMMILMIILRFILISSKYAYQTDGFLQLIQTRSLTKEELTSKLILFKWREQSDDIIEYELQMAILRLEIDSSLFFFTFLSKISPELQYRLEKGKSLSTKANLTSALSDRENPRGMTALKAAEDSNRNESENERPSLQRNSYKSEPVKKSQYSQTRTSIMINDEKEKVKQKGGSNKKSSISKVLSAVHNITSAFSHFFDEKKLEDHKLYGYNLAHDLIKNSKSTRYNHVGKISLTISIIRALIPTGYRLYLVLYKKEDTPIFTTQPFIVGFLFLLNIFFFWANSFMIAVALSDVRSKIYCFKQIGYLISPKKLSYFRTKKLYPTLNLFDPITLKTWRNLRRTISEYGKEYYVRNNLNISLIMAVYSFVACIILLQFFGILTIYSDPMLLIVLSYESVVFFVIFVYVMGGTAFLNDQYKVHKYLLTQNKSIIADFHRMSHIYAGENAIEPENCIYRAALRMFREEFGEENFEEKVANRADALTTMIDDIVEELEFEEMNEPLTVMGIKIDYSFLKSMLVGGVSVIFALAQYSLNK